MSVIRGGNGAAALSTRTRSSSGLGVSSRRIDRSGVGEGGLSEKSYPQLRHR
jgi:hypothetical protein